MIHRRDAEKRGERAEIIQLSVRPLCSLRLCGENETFLSSKFKLSHYQGVKGITFVRLPFNLLPLPLLPFTFFRASF